MVWLWQEFLWFGRGLWYFRLELLHFRPRFMKLSSFLFQIGRLCSSLWPCCKNCPAFFTHCLDFLQDYPNHQKWLSANCFNLYTLNFKLSFRNRKRKGEWKGNSANDREGRREIFPGDGTCYAEAKAEHVARGTLTVSNNKHQLTVVLQVTFIQRVMTCFATKTTEHTPKRSKWCPWQRHCVDQEGWTALVRKIRTNGQLWRVVCDVVFCKVVQMKQKV